MINLIKGGIEKEIKELNAALKSVNIKKEKELTLDVIRVNSFDLDLSSKKSFLYIIKSVNQIDKDIAKNIRNKKYGYAMCRVNDNFDINQDNCLYVGSSHNIKKRIIEHLGLGGSPKTYAMHLREWWDYGLITIEIYSVENDKYLQLYEDILWDYYKPLLGRQGKK